ncbi:hypothetical protein K1T71_012820 [Dendrolimus kikuchii]|uniref:Uncharacterized protein n=1 Tax=Dendrolimus kikuchii TaxID=765133 RepID=A0ACC1CI66_9NEOP|nr:hypothetical protein K1T71_012820 [Dendrolimus kikuchii]
MIVRTIFAILLSPVFGQFDPGVRPDVTFGEQNDRFDIGDIMEEQNQAEDAENFRRHMENQANLLEVAGNLQESATNNLAKTLENTFIDNQKPQETEFSFSQAKEDQGTEDDFEKSFKVFKMNAKKIEQEYKGKENDNRRSERIMKYLHGGEAASRRASENINPDAEILLHYAVPVVLQIQGYVQAPLYE